MSTVEIRHFHLFCGLGGGAAGFNKASPRVGNMQASFRCIGGVDVDLAAIRDFGKLSGVAGTVLGMTARQIEAYEKEVEEALLNNNPLPDHSWMPPIVCKWGGYRVAMMEMAA